MLTQARLKQLLHYDPDTGVFIRTTSTGSTKAGAAVGTAHCKGYYCAMVDYKKYLLHRLAFLYMTGEWPEHDVDHINGVRTDNRWANLRPATSAENRQNIRRAKSNSASGVLGVSWHRGAGKWQAQIKHEGKTRALGLFLNPDDAHAAYLEAKRSLHTYCTI